MERKERLTTTKIFSEAPEIEKAVYDFFPVSKEEKRCLTKKAIADDLRLRMAKKLYEEKYKT